MRVAGVTNQARRCCLGVTGVAGVVGQRPRRDQRRDLHGEPTHRLAVVVEVGRIRLAVALDVRARPGSSGRATSSRLRKNSRAARRRCAAARDAVTVIGGSFRYRFAAATTRARSRADIDRRSRGADEGDRDQNRYRVRQIVTVILSTARPPHDELGRNHDAPERRPAAPVRSARESAPPPACPARRATS